MPICLIDFDVVDKDNSIFVETVLRTDELGSFRFGFKLMPIRATLGKMVIRCFLVVRAVLMRNLPVLLFIKFVLKVLDGLFQMFNFLKPCVMEPLRSCKLTNSMHL